jgi:hypothetical protein
MLRARFTAVAAAATVAAGLLSLSPAAATRTHSTFYGRVDHVSTSNIKVTDPRNGQSLSFLLLPKFKQVFSADGKTTLQMSYLHKGTPVEVVYDQTALGARHADKIIVLKHLPAR